MKDGWLQKPIGDAFRIVNGGTPKTGVFDYWDGQHQWITPAEMGGLQSPYVSKSRRTLTNEGLRVGAELVPPQSIILSTRAPIGHLVINEVPMAFNQGCKGLVPSIEIETKFAYYFLLANVPLLQTLGTGATFKELSGGKLKEVTFHFPTKPEQRRIVEILDEAFEAIGMIRGNAEKSLRHAQGAFEALQATTLAKQGLDWRTESVSTLVGDGVLVKPQDGNHGEIHPTKSDFVKVGVPFIMAADLINGEVDTKNCRFISEKQARSLRIGFAKDGDVLLSHKGTIGRTALLKTDREFVVLTPQITYYRTKDLDRLDRRYLYYYFLSPKFQSELNKEAKGGATRAYIGITRQLDLKIVVPPIQAQRELAKRFADVEAEKSKYETAVAQKIAALDALKKSLLHHAFAGKLTAKSADKQLESVA